MSSKRISTRGTPTAREVQASHVVERMEGSGSQAATDTIGYALAAVLTVTQESQEKPARYVLRCSNR